ncbi:DNA-directed RNA polymerase sigma-70 factor [Paractinoplanes abujensis]|uniref:RNA polymerase sigma-70 factor (ECF subfamily) n=1 Tax=Paractinoplanes abujensis TaxID=882441 RepID=A0A7W7CPJ6_9ACTN|nr:RNA polymerase sigma factor [Actinoplanes abujensis]MBB4690950.1 RNA polymerase sigma-70 factor (ECF subfamily) [Actinoplanes abujensis]GID17637.1 DNA-directed RNA polymerase sigma-70 factor [Actinoplanes abujensis]
MRSPTTAAAGADDLAGMFGRHARELLRYCTRRVGPQLAEDVVAETFLVAHERRHRFDPARGELLPWLYGIATRLLRRHVREEVRALRQVALVPDAGHDEAAAHRVDAQREVARLPAVLAKLPRRQRDVLMLYAVAELEYAEIAAALEIPLGSVQSSLHRARAKVKAALSEEDNR